MRHKRGWQAVEKSAANSIDQALRPGRTYGRDAAITSHPGKVEAADQTLGVTLSSIKHQKVPVILVGDIQNSKYSLS